MSNQILKSDDIMGLVKKTFSLTPYHSFGGEMRFWRLD
jgi:hypothetical protein